MLQTPTNELHWIWASYNAETCKQCAESYISRYINANNSPTCDPTIKTASVISEIENVIIVWVCVITYFQYLSIWISMLCLRSSTIFNFQFSA